MTIPTLPGITTETITTDRITTRVLFAGPDDGIPVLMLHGNLSSATWLEELMLSLPEEYRAIAPDMRSYGDADPAKKIDARRGLGDLADDAVALLDHLGIKQTHLLAHSLGGNVAWRLMMDVPQRLLSVTLVAPGSPYGFGSTLDVDGTPTYEDFAGSGGGLINPQVVGLIKQGNRATDSPFAMRNLLRAGVFKPPFVPEREEEILSSSLATHIGEQDYPGDTTTSKNWPYTAPGQWGPNNALSPKYADDVQRLFKIKPKPPLLWIRGAHDRAVSDTAASDAGTLGQLSLIPNYPGPDVFPPQPMLSQIRKVLERYAAAGGTYTEVIMDEVAHAPYIEDLTGFNAHFLPFLEQNKFGASKNQNPLVTWYSKFKKALTGEE